jgi:glycosyltransferase involved in cell wall biosynthesis
MSSVDVIVPCYRYGRYLRECVESVLTQSVEKLRILIIDDASPDHTADVGLELAREDSRITFIQHPDNKGHIATYNEGIAWAAADYLLLLSADDYLLPGALKRATDLMDGNPDVGFTFGKAIDLTDGDTVRHTHTFANTTVAAVISDNAGCAVLSGKEFFTLIQSSGLINIVRAPTAVVRTELQKRLGGYRPELPQSGDMEMWLRLAAHAEVGVIGTYQAIYRLHGSNMQNEYYRDNWFPDLLQRKAAVECLFETYSRVLPNDQELYRSLLKPLGREAVRQASGAFNDNKLDLSRQLCTFAICVYPEITRTMPWLLLNCKRGIGVKLSRSLVFWTSKVRHMASRLS